MSLVSRMFKSTAGMVLLVTIVVMIVVHIKTGTFFTAYNISTLTRSASFVMLVGFGQTLVLLTGGIDLSVSALGSLCALISATLMRSMGVNFLLSIVIGCLLGFVFGLVNGFFVAYVKMTPFIVTLATMQIYKGIVYVANKGMPITGLPAEAEELANGVIAGVLPNIVIIMIVVCIILELVLRRTQFGRHVYALGGNRSCARIVGIPVARNELLIYGFSGLLAAIAAVLMACKLASFQVSIGESWQMDSITAAVLGGTSMAGGVGSVVGTIIGGLLSAVITTSITLLRVDTYYTTIVTGAVVIIAVLIDAIKGNPVMRENIARAFKRKK